MYRKILSDLFRHFKLYPVQQTPRNFYENMSNFLVSTVPADGLALLGAKT